LSAYFLRSPKRPTAGAANCLRSVPVFRDPRVETLTSWARSGGQLSDRAEASLAALEDSAPGPATAPALAYVATAAYARVPSRGPRDLLAGNRVVGVLSELGEAGGRELLGLRAVVGYRHARRTIDKALAYIEKAVGVPSGELEDAFASVELDRDLRTIVPVGPFHAVLAVTGDLRRVQTTWRDAKGRETSRRPRATAGLDEELEVVQDVTRRLRAHVAVLRRRFEQMMLAGDSWTAEDWSARMFNDPLRAAMSRRLIWRLERDRRVLVLPEQAGLTNVRGGRVRIGPSDHLALWHPADDPAAQADWTNRFTELGLEQPIDQAGREVTLADPGSPQLSFAVGRRVEQIRFRGFLRTRGWEAPYMGRWHFVGEATRELSRHGPAAVLDIDLDWDGEDPDVVVIGALRFRSVLGAELDARALPPAIVSEASRDVLGVLTLERRG
jgi:hypothetical protein